MIDQWLLFTEMSKNIAFSFEEFVERWCSTRKQVESRWATDTSGEICDKSSGCSQGVTSVVEVSWSGPRFPDKDLHVRVRVVQDEQRYQKVLEDHLLPHFTTFRRRNPVAQQDNASAQSQLQIGLMRKELNFRSSQVVLQILTRWKTYEAYLYTLYIGIVPHTALFLS
ncbi:hypothetical protein NECAME_05786 [Necator americanus]|uniref:Uncharacterized protein n=1 Tax=Necator americanus TaxID=51031 RepID=W2TXZ9_NECAM|nr:hypothetical protein NECAME_05786 [Necator americanus]ETN86940.1 hypothetical protein NECAME_05786 [Necator americanus]